MIPLFIYKDTHLPGQITKAYIYKNKGVEKKGKGVVHYNVEEWLAITSEMRSLSWPCMWQRRIVSLKNINNTQIW